MDAYGPWVIRGLTVVESLTQDTLDPDFRMNALNDIQRFVATLGVREVPDGACAVVGYAGDDSTRPDALVLSLDVTPYAARFLWTWSASARHVTEALALLPDDTETVALPPECRSLPRALHYLQARYRSHPIYPEYVERIPS